MEPVFLDLDHVLRIHLSMISHYGGRQGVRDLGLLQSAVTMPRAAFAGQPVHKDLFEMAAAYLYHIVCNHPFVDGNKRTGAGAALVFLTLNGIQLQADEEGLVEITLAVAEGRADKRQVADFFRRLSH
ncbi:MAG: type II toxin-antitoxin system death-on-curing family toxin [Planctomycetota bacterium]|nr:MAG: type II toxin-antitoxin system death-on-curing family toxin [Planctomycetota bacterium]